MTTPLIASTDRSSKSFLTQKRQTLGGISFSDNRQIDPGGIRYSELSAKGRGRLEALLAIYTGRIRRGHAEIRYSEAKRYLTETLFAWIGPRDCASPFYYRILNPVILIEFDQMPGIVYDNDTPSRDHNSHRGAHIEWQRLWQGPPRQHYAHHDHSHPMTAHRQGD